MAWANKPLRERRSHLRADGKRTGRLAEDGDVVRVAAKGRDVALHPLDSRQFVEQPVVAGRVVGILRGQFRGGEETENAQPVIHGDNQHAFAA